MFTDNIAAPLYKVILEDPLVELMEHIRGYTGKNVGMG
jgi:hypothetical protein